MTGVVETFKWGTTVLFALVGLYIAARVITLGVLKSIQEHKERRKENGFEKEKEIDEKK